MSIRLQGGYEVIDFWRKVRDIGNYKLEEFGLSDWTVTLRPATASDAEHAEQGDETAFSRWDRERHEVEMSFIENGAMIGTAEEVALTQIVDLVDQIAHPDPLDDDGDAP